jgi:hypothetical protein
MFPDINCFQIQYTSRSTCNGMNTQQDRKSFGPIDQQLLKLTLSNYAGQWPSAHGTSRNLHLSNIHVASLNTPRECYRIIGLYTQWEYGSQISYKCSTTVVRHQSIQPLYLYLLTLYTIRTASTKPIWVSNPLKFLWAKTTHKVNMCQGVPEDFYN